MHALETSKLITEEYSAKILLGTMGTPKSAFDLSQDYNIPIAACYRKIHSLEEAGLLVCAEKKLTRAGKRMGYYSSAVLHANITMERHKIHATIILTDGRCIQTDYTREMAKMMGESSNAIVERAPVLGDA